MDLMQAIRERHSVRQYTDTPLTPEEIAALQAEIDHCNAEGGLHFQLVTNEPKAFDSRMAHYGKFSGVSSYFALIGPKGPDLDEKCGYYGERLVLAAQMLGLNTCWVAMTYKRIPDVFTVDPGEKLVIVISVGHGQTQGNPHRSKAFPAAVTGSANLPAWFIAGVECALLAPTATNQQKFQFGLKDGKVMVKTGLGPCIKVDLGIVKYHFEVGAGKENFEWA